MSDNRRGDQGAALLRLAGLPVRLWLAGGCPRLFSLLAESDRSADDYRRSAARLAERIGERLVPLRELADQDRVRLIALRRTLHHGLPVDGDQHAALVERIGLLPDPGPRIAAELRSLAERSRWLHALDAHIASEIAAEQVRLRGLPWRLLRSSPAGAAALAHDAPDALADVERRLAAGEDWDDKRLRQRGDYLWRLIGRGAVKTTPRTWLGHVALVDITDTAGTRDDGDRRLLSTRDGSEPVAARYAVHQVSNVYTSRPDPADGAASGQGEVSLTGLHWLDGEDLVCWVVDQRGGTHTREVRLRNTPVLDAVRRALAGGPRERDDVLAQLLGARTRDPGAVATLTAFLDHLVQLGVVQRAARVTNLLSDWRHSPTGASTEDGSAFVDVYRQVRAVVSASAVERVRQATAPALRLAALIQRERKRPRHPVLELLDERRRTVPELVRRYLQEHRDQRPPAPEGAPRDWPRADRPDSGYARLLACLADRCDRGEDPIRIDARLLEAVGATGTPEIDADWPLDLMLRPLPSGGPLAVLETASAPATTDARFADGLGQLHGEPALVADYRAFLRDRERRDGGRFVEVLVPPLSERAANAVRRPRYTDLWTGDPDHRAYHPPPDRSDSTQPGDARPRYLPLHAITLRLVDGRAVAEAEGQVVWPMYHATRVPLPPWDIVMALLRAAAPEGSRRGIRWSGLLAAFPTRDHLPRVQIEDDLVLCPAQWRVRRAELWPAGATTVDKLRVLSRLMARRGVPRWVFAAPGAAARPVPVDLAGLPAVRIVDRLLAAPDVEEILVEEMLPTPDQAAVSDTAHAPGDRLVAQLLLRLPAASAPFRPAVRAAPRPTEVEPAAGT
ncbi:lantibiotic dehydratase [Streptoalloteichus hindustanus]|uniref:Lantibiotic dehydratase, C terminus n=1 Tax=Streptoalloteichus hindustanus TaxID=2017 RepID=A0A1M5JSZ8_STRHI|nr:lantibiotic dehydratase [Streptoalloteichus hindustanus]SHG43742.1 Lantibiotic dehydratase, C terminus [Streptoalloteichus hindustanus]